jgi:carboxypeptidase PM20D1
VLEHVRRVVHDARVSARVLAGTMNEPSAVTPVDAEPFQLLARTIRQVVPGTVVTPWLLVAGTDSRHYERLTPNVLRFAGAMIGKDDLPRIHGTNERIGVQDYVTEVRLYLQLLRNAAM